MRTILLVLVLAGPANAELLLAFQHSIVGPDMGSLVPVAMKLELPGLTLGGLVLPEDEGRVFTTTPEQLAGAQFSLNGNQDFVSFCIYTSFEYGGHNIWTAPGISPAVPQLGPGLAGYKLTEITLTIDKLDWTIEHGTAYATGQHTIALYGEEESGDFNADGAVDAADYVAWRDIANPDIDYVAWQGNFGGPTASASLVAGSVPEPSSLALLIAACLMSMRFRRQPSSRCRRS